MVKWINADEFTGGRVSLDHLSLISRSWSGLACPFCLWCSSPMQTLVALALSDLCPSLSHFPFWLLSLCPCMAFVFLFFLLFPCPLHILPHLPKHAFSASDAGLLLNFPIMGNRPPLTILWFHELREQENHWISWVFNLVLSKSSFNKLENKKGERKKLIYPKVGQTGKALLSRKKGKQCS